MRVHTVIETPVYLRAAAAAGLTAREMIAIVDFLAADPLAGNEIPGTGGCRKVRFGGRGKGKSGGYHHYILQRLECSGVSNHELLERRTRRPFGRGAQWIVEAGQDAR